MYKIVTPKRLIDGAIKLVTPADHVREAMASNNYKCWDGFLCPTLVESGTFMGSAVWAAIMKGVREIHSMEIDPFLYDLVCDCLEESLQYTPGSNGDRQQFKSTYIFKNVWPQGSISPDVEINLYMGDSCELLPQILEKLDKRAFFWLDGHVSHGEGEGFANKASKIGGKTPALHEIEIIKEHYIKEHSILVDMDTEFYRENEHLFIEALGEINPDYIIERPPRFDFNTQNFPTAMGNSEAGWVQADMDIPIHPSARVSYETHKDFYVLGAKVA